MAGERPASRSLRRVARRPVARRPTVSCAADVRSRGRARLRATRAPRRSALGPADQLLEVGCGGGLLLRDALVTGASVTAGPQRRDIALAREQRLAPTSYWRKLSVCRSPTRVQRHCDVRCLLLPRRPVGVLRECRRVLRRGGRVAVYTTGPELRETPAAPEPIASEVTSTETKSLRSSPECAAPRSQRSQRARGQLLTARA